MTDTTIIMLSKDTWEAIAQFLPKDDLAKFRKICKTTQLAIPMTSILQLYYDRLCEMDKTLPPILPPDEEQAKLIFTAGFKKIEDRHQKEIVYLKPCHPSFVSQYLPLEQTPSPIANLEIMHMALDNINTLIILSEVHVLQNYLSLNHIGLTRIPVALFHEEKYADFWENLVLFECNNNLLIELDLHNLPALVTLYCQDNPLSKLSVQDCTSLLSLNYNIEKHQTLIDLNLTGASQEIQNKFGKLEEALLFKQLYSAQKKNKAAFIERLGERCTNENRQVHCPEYSEMAFETDVNIYKMGLSRAPVYLPFSSANFQNDVKIRNEPENKKTTGNKLYF